MREDVDRLLGDRPHTWDVVDVDSDPELAQRFGESIPILSVNGRPFAKTRLPPFATRLRLLRAAARS
jgi:hypothetical protein